MSVKKIKDWKYVSFSDGTLGTFASEIATWIDIFGEDAIIHFGVYDFDETSISYYRDETAAEAAAREKKVAKDRATAKKAREKKLAERAVLLAQSEVDERAEYERLVAKYGGM